MKSLKDIQKIVSKFNVKPRPEMRSRILDDALRIQRNRNRQSTPGTYIWRIIMKNKISKFAVAAIILVVVLLISPMMSTQSAYAKVAEQLRKARTLTYTLIRQTNLQPDQTVRINVAHKAPHLLRTTTVDGYTSILNDAKGKMITLVPASQMYVTAEYKNVPELKGGDMFEIIERMKNLPRIADEQLGEKEFDNVLAEGYRVFEEDTTITIWIDKDTDELVLIKQEYPSSPGMDYIIRDIQTDVSLDDSLFSLTPPAGYKEGPKLSADVAKVTEDDFIRFFETWVNLSVDKTFPPTFWSPEFGKIVIELAKQGKFARPWTDADAQTIYQGNMFLAQIPQDDWRYMGQNVKYGDPNIPVFWYRPPGSENYRVIYADLSVKEVAPENLPE